MDTRYTSAEEGGFSYTPGSPRIPEVTPSTGGSDDLDQSSVLRPARRGRQIPSTVQPLRCSDKSSFDPHYVVTLCSEVWKVDWIEPIFCYSDASEEAKRRWFDTWRKSFTWSDSDDILIRKRFKKEFGDILRSAMYKARGKYYADANYRPSWVPQKEKAILRTKPIVEEAIKEVYNSLQPKSLVVADLGCSSGPNTVLLISEIVEAICVHCRELGRNPPEIQYFLNDLPGNDFNTIFDYSEKFKEKLKEAKGEEIVPYVVGVPGSFYGRLFPRHTVHFIHSNYSLQWLSQVPQGLESDTGLPLNKGNIYIARSSPQIVVESYLKQFQKDFSTFLRLRFQELVTGGRMVLIFLGRTKTPCGELSSCFGLLADALNAMVLEGLMNEAKVDAFNLPIYAPSMEEVMTIVETTRLFHVEQVEIFETNWDPFDDSSDDDDSVFNNFESGKNVANCSIRAVVEPIFEKYFGEAIMDELFSRYSKNVARHLSGKKGKYVVFAMALRK